MNHLQQEISIFKVQILKMMSLVDQQFREVKDLLFSFDMPRAEAIFQREHEVDQCEIENDRSGENLLALFQPVAIDLRFVLASLKINNDVERIADYIEGIARQLVYLEETVNPELLAELQLNRMADHAHAMFSMAVSAFDKEDVNLAQQVFEQDAFLDDLNLKGYAILEKAMRKNPELIRQGLYLFAILRKLERIGDLNENIAEDVIFYVEAKVLKHQSRPSQ